MVLTTTNGLRDYECSVDKGSRNCVCVYYPKMFNPLRITDPHRHYICIVDHNQIFEILVRKMTRRKGLLVVWFCFIYRHLL